MSSFYVGIDWSMSSPGLCIGNSNNIIMYSFNNDTKTKKLPEVYNSENINIYLYDKDLIDITSPETRFHSLSEWCINIINAFDIEFPIILEGYSYASKGQVFNIGENGGVLKHKLWEYNFKFETPTPSQIKKFATGKGNANKELMGECFLNKTGCDLTNIYNKDWDSSPISDLVDAYWMMSYGENIVKSNQLEIS